MYGFSPFASSTFASPPRAPASAPTPSTKTPTTPPPTASSTTTPPLEGHGLTFTLGRGTELCVLALEYLAQFVIGRTLRSITDDFVAFTRQLTGDTQFRWLGPEKGVIHLACGALINAVWDLYAKVEGKPALAAARRHAARAARLAHRLPLHRRRPHPG